MIINETANKLAGRLLTEEEQSERLKRGRLTFSAALPAVNFVPELVDIEWSPPSESADESSLRRQLPELANLSSLRRQLEMFWRDVRSEGAGE